MKSISTGVTLTFTIKSLDDIYRVTSRLTELLSVNTSAENARLVPDIEEGTIYLEIREIEPSSEFIQEIVEDFRSLKVGEVQIKNYVVPDMFSDVPSVEAQVGMLEAVTTSPPDLQKQLQKESDPTSWLPKEFERISFTLEEIRSEVNNLKSALDELKTDMTVMKTKEEMAEKAEKRFYERSNFWFGLVSVIATIIALLVSLMSMGFFAPP